MELKPDMTTDEKGRMVPVKVRVHFIDGSERLVPATGFKYVGEEGARSAIALVDGREVPIYKRAEPEWGNLWEEQMTYNEWLASRVEEAE
jgi:hypothetical protein